MSAGKSGERKRVRPPAVKRDPVIAALIAKLPAENGQFTRPQRINWLRQVAMAFDGAYGVQSKISIEELMPDNPALSSDNPALSVSSGSIGTSGTVRQPTPAPLFAAAEDDEIRYFVDPDGFARKSPGNVRIRPVDIPGGAELEDERADDDSLDTIKWADGNWPPAAYPNPITIVKA